MHLCENVNFDTYLNFFKSMYKSMMIPMKAMRQMTMMIISRSSSGNPLCVMGVVVDVKLWPSVVESSSVVLCVDTWRNAFWTICHVFYIENVELVLWFHSTLRKNLTTFVFKKINTRDLYVDGRYALLATMFTSLYNLFRLDGLRLYCSTKLYSSLVMYET